MAGFHYQHGDRPLDGYTIEHAVGRGGFGEVYYAVSDSGREVALKAIQGYEQIEIRGVSQCMNLKSPHLVSIFDIRDANDGTPFVIMEYVSGPSLRELLNDSPAGLGTQKAAFFLRELAKGLTYLHDRGIVHRDLKPGNIFYEDGYVKIGDYGLSKAMSASMHSGQTITVGTVHYMAPEVGQGRYDRSIDIYALGVLLYEMLTGQVPYFGSSHGEILMKHLTAEPDLTHVEEPFARAIRKALAKDPGERYASVQEMVEDVFGAAHIQESVSHFSPDSLSMVAERAGRKVQVGGGSSGHHGLGGGYIPGEQKANDGSSGEWTQRFHDRAGEVRPAVPRSREQAIGTAQGGGRDMSLPVHPGSPPWMTCNTTRESARAMPLAAAKAFDPISNTLRVLLCLATPLMLAFGIAVIQAGIMVPSDHDRAIPGYLIFSYLLVCGTSLGLFLSHRFLLKFLEHEGGLLRRIATTACTLAVAFVPGFIGMMSLADIFGWRIPHEEMLFASLGAMAAILFLTGWEPVMSPLRKERLMLRYPILIGGFAFLLAWLFGGYAVLAFGMMASVVITVQLMTAFVPEHARSAAWEAVGVTEPPEPDASANGTSPAVSPPPLQAAAERDQANDRQPPALPDYAAVQNMFVSPRRRLWALIFAVVPLVPVIGVPVCGIQRFYAGKIGTGILWLCTFGLLGIGQIIDLILILVGQFRDREGREIRLWHDPPSASSSTTATSPPKAAAARAPSPAHAPAPPAAPVAATSPRAPIANGKRPQAAMNVSPRANTRQVPSSFRRFMTNRPLAFLAFLFLGWATATGAFRAFDMPHLMQAHVLGDDLPRELTQTLGYSEWPGLLERGAGFLSFTTLIIGGCMLVFARRRAQGGHAARAVLGSVFLGFGMHLIHKKLALDAWFIGECMEAEPERVGPALEHVINAITAPPVMTALVILMGGAAMLLWPEKDRGLDESNNRDNTKGVT